MTLLMYNTKFGENARREVESVVLQCKKKGSLPARGAPAVSVKSDFW
jgi:hypothetical protein